MVCEHCDSNNSDDEMPKIGMERFATASGRSRLSGCTHQSHRSRRMSAERPDDPFPRRLPTACLVAGCLSYYPSDAYCAHQLLLLAFVAVLRDVIVIVYDRCGARGVCFASVEIPR